MRIAVDTWGGDLGPDAVTEGAWLAARRFGADLVLLGEPGRIRTRLAALGAQGDRIAIEACGTRGGLRDTRGAPAIGTCLLKEGAVEAFVSADDTGAVLLAAIRNMGRIAGVQRPCIAAPLPTHERQVLLLDAGANPDCQPEHVADFALMGSIYARHRMQRDTPRVFLLCNGVENAKGNALTRATHVLLSAMDGIAYQGYAEPYRLLQDDVDVLVTDGYTGNILVKGMETTSRMYALALQAAFRANWQGRLGYALAQANLDQVRRKANPHQYGGAVLLGLEGVVTVAHGNSNAEAMCNAIRQAMEAVEHNVVGQLAQALERAL